MTIISIIGINFGAIYGTEKSGYHDRPSDAVELESNQQTMVHAHRHTEAGG